MRSRTKFYRTGVRRCMTALLAAAVLFSGILAAPPDGVWAFSSQEIETSYYEGSNIAISIEGKEMRVTVPDTEEYAYIIVTFMDSRGNAPQEAKPARVSGGTVVYQIEEQRDGVYYIQLYRGAEEKGNFTNVIGGMESIAVLSEGGAVRIMPSPVYDSSAAVFESQAVSADALSFYLKPSENAQSDHSEIAGAAAEITEGLTAPYDRLIAVHDWVASNIYYDYDAVQSGGSWPKDALGTLRSKRSVCEGYANLATALLRASGIPAKTILGYALYAEDNSWNLSNMYGDRANHAWTEAFVDGRWILMDTTWDSDNFYRNGKYQTSEALHTYFDSTLEFFSYSHRQSRDEEYDSSYIKTAFSDISGHWAYEPIRFTVNHDLMNGVGDSLFAPDAPATQAMFAAVLARMSEADEASGGGRRAEDGYESREDRSENGNSGEGEDGNEAEGVDGNTAEREAGNAAEGGAGNAAEGADGNAAESGDWEDDAVSWARENGILAGLEDDFSPDEEADRETMAVMLQNYILRVEPELATQWENGTPGAIFADDGEISEEARDAVYDAVSWGLLKGCEDGYFLPEAGFTRAEMAAVIERIQYKKILYTIY